MNTDSGDRSSTKALRRVLFAGMVSVAGVAGLSAPASAQFWGGGWFGPIPIPGPAPADPGAAIPVRMVARIVAAQGFRLTDYPVRRGNRVIALGVDGRGQMMRFVIDAYDGAVLRASLVGAPRPPGYIGNSDAYAYGGPAYGAPDAPLEAAPAQKRKPKVKTAAKHPAPLPQAAPASPAAPPSQATQAPAAPAPVAPPAAASTPPAAPAAATPASPAPAAPTVAAPEKPAQPAPPVVAAPPPDVRPAPDAQPSADIGPKVVPVKPTEAKAPEPDSWDTEAQPKAQAVTPDQANKIEPERHEDK